MRRQVLIIGAGASGLMAAIHAARAGALVTLLEHKEQAGKKILSTGNGRCNLTNLDQREEYYRCSQKGFPQSVLTRFTVEDTLDFFEGLGIVPKSRNGYIYPNSDQASSVLEALLLETNGLGVKILYECRVHKIEKREGRFCVSSSQGEYLADALILAAGSKAAPVTGSDGSGYELAAALGHKVITPLPALVQLRCREPYYRQLAGVRTEARLSLFADQTFLAGERGELQLTDYGISGIPTFQVSRYACAALHRKQKVTVTIDFLPHMSEKEAEEFLGRRRQSLGERTCGQWMNGLLNRKLSLVLLKLSGIEKDEKINGLSPRQWDRLLRQITAYETTVIAANPFENAQVCCGGVDTRQIYEGTLESRLVRDLYFCGEILDVDGCCGGYNLQWAWSSGAAAGTSAAGSGNGVKSSPRGTGHRAAAADGTVQKEPGRFHNKKRKGRT